MSMHELRPPLQRSPCMAGACTPRPTAASVISHAPITSFILYLLLILLDGTPPVSSLLLPSGLALRPDPVRCSLYISLALISAFEPGIALQRRSVLDRQYLDESAMHVHLCLVAHERSLYFLFASWIICASHRHYPLLALLVSVDAS